jgi:tyrosinase
MSEKSNFTLSFIGINDNAAPNAAYITWTPTKFRISRSDNSNSEKLTLNQEQLKDTVPEFPKDIDLSKLGIPTILFYDSNVPNSKGEESYEIQFKAGESHKDIFLGGKFQAEKLFNGASPEDLDIKIKAIKDGKEITAIKTMIRVRKNANLLSKNAKAAYLHALSTINKTDAEGRGIGIYSTDFFKMHVKGSRSIAHGTEVFLPWHRLYLLDLERQLQNVDPKVSLHYWKFDEPAPNIFKADFLGESIIDKAENPIMTNGVSTNFARFNADNPLKYWSIDREKLIRRMSWFDNQKEQAGFNDSEQQSFYPVQKESDTYAGKQHLFKQVKDKNGNLITDDKSFTVLEGDPHGYTHVSNNGFINYVPTAPKDPIFFFLHSNVERMWGKWQTMHKLFDPTSEDNYPNQKEDPSIPSWKNINAQLWPWNGKVTPNEYHYEAPGTRTNNFTISDCYKNFENNSPIIKDALDPFGVIDYNNYLGFEYDDAAPFLNTYSPKTEKNNNKLIQSLKKSGLRILHKEKDIEDLIEVMEQLVNRRSLTKENANKSFASTSNNSSELRNALNTLTLNKIFSSEIPKLSATINNTLEKLLTVADHIEEVDAILIPLVYADNRDIIHQLELNFKKIEADITSDVSVRYYDSDTDKYETKAFSKYLVIYLLALYDYEFIQDDKIYDLITKNKEIIFKKIGENEYLDLLISLLAFASNKTISKIFQTSLKSTNFLVDLETKLKNTKDQKTANKLWALHTLFNNAISK